MTHNAIEELTIALALLKDDHEDVAAHIRSVMTTIKLAIQRIEDASYTEPVGGIGTRPGEYIQSSVTVYLFDGVNEALKLLGDV